MTARQLALWSEGQETIKVTATDGGIVIAHKVTAESRARSLTLPRNKTLLVALREACDQAIRGLEAKP